MASSTLKFLLGLYPDTEHIEKRRDELIKEFEKLNRIAKSDELARYEFLNKFVNSAEFAERKRYYQSLVFKNSEEEQKENEYFRLKKSHDIKFYYKFRILAAYTQYKSMDGSKEIADFEKLKAFIESAEFKKVEDYMKDKKKWEKTEDFSKLQEYESLSKNPSFKYYYKFTNAKEYENFKKLYKSKEITAFQEREKYIQSQEFLTFKDSFNKKNYKQSDAFKKYQEYVQLKKSPHYKHFFTLVKNNYLQDYKRLHNSKELAYYIELEAFVKSPHCREKKKQIKSLLFKQTDEYKKLQEYKSLSKNQSYKNYFKFINAKEYDDFKELYQSPEITAYEALEKYVNSQEFISFKNSFSKKNYKQSDAYRKYLEYLQWKKAQHYKDYFTLAKSNFLSDYKKLHNTKELAHYQKLEAFVKSPQFKEKEKEIKSLRFEQTDEYRKLQEYKKLASSKRIRAFYKMKSSDELAEFIRIEKSKQIPDYEKLEKHVLSDKFKERKAYLLDKKKWEKTDEYSQLQEYIPLKKSPNIIWYNKHKNSPKYGELRTWNLVFDDEFNAGSLDRNKWLTRYFWGEVLLRDTYALSGEKHLFTDGKNLELNGSAIKIVTRGENISGKEWIPALGFYPKNFNYTSGLISSGSSFRTKYGKIEAKIKLDASNGIIHAFWLAGNTIVPQIDVFKCYNNKLFLSTFWGNPADTKDIQKDTVSLRASKFTGKFFIYSLEWSPEKMVWRINNVEVKIQTSNIPAEPMYVVLNSGVVNDKPHIPTQMEIDWVRCYQRT